MSRLSPANGCSLAIISILVASQALPAARACDDPSGPTLIGLSANLHYVLNLFILAGNASHLAFKTAVDGYPFSFISLSPVAGGCAVAAALVMNVRKPSATLGLICLASLATTLHPIFMVDVGFTCLDGPGAWLFLLSCTMSVAVCFAPHRLWGNFS